MSETALTVAGTSDVLGPVPMDALMAAASRFEAAVKMGEVYAASGLFKDVKTAAQAVVKIMAGFEMGVGPAAAMAGIHIITTRGGTSVTAGGNLMATMVRASGIYDYEVEAMDNEQAVIQFFRVPEDGEWRLLGKSTFTIGEAKAAGLVRSGSAWEHYPSDMLFNRAMSRGYKKFTPDASGGVRVYTPEEVGGPLNKDGELDVSLAEFAVPIEDNEQIDKEPRVGVRQANRAVAQFRLRSHLEWGLARGLIAEETISENERWIVAAGTTAAKTEIKAKTWDAYRARWMSGGLEKMWASLLALRDEGRLPSLSEWIKAVKGYLREGAPSALREVEEVYRDDKAIIEVSAETEEGTETEMDDPLALAFVAGENPEENNNQDDPKEGE